MHEESLRPATRRALLTENGVALHALLLLVLQAAG
jgi:hypothetical protein